MNSTTDHADKGKDFTHHDDADCCPCPCKADKAPTCGHLGVQWDNDGNCIKCARDKVLATTELTIDEAIQKFADYARGNGDFDELDLKEVLVEHYRKLFEEIIGSMEPSSFDDDDYMCNNCKTYIEDPAEGEAKCFCEMRNNLRAEQRARLNELMGDM